MSSSEQKSFGAKTRCIDLSEHFNWPCRVPGDEFWQGLKKEVRAYPEGKQRPLGIPFEMVFILTTAKRYVPLIGTKIRNIIDAQQYRGIDLRPRLKNAVNFMAL